MRARRAWRAIETDLICTLQETRLETQWAHRCTRRASSGLDAYLSYHPRMPHSSMARSLGALSLCLLLATACNQSPDATPRDGDTPSPGGSTGRIRSLLYAGEGSVFSYDLDVEETGGLIALPGRDLTLSPDGRTLAFTEGGADPQISVLSVAALDDDPVGLGPGESPTWAPGSESIAAVTGVEGYEICPLDEKDPSKAEKGGKGCVEADRVVVYRPAEGPGGDPVTALGANVWTILGWAQDGVLGAGQSTTTVYWGKPGQTAEEVRHFGISPQQMWGGSPVEPLFLITPPGKKFFIDSAGQRGADVDVPGKLGPGVWSPDGSHVLVVVQRQGRRSAALIEVQTGTVEFIEGSDDPASEIVWAPDGGSFAFASPMGDPQVKMCSVSLDCRTLFEPGGPVHLLGFSDLSPE